MTLYATNRFAGDGATTSYEFNFAGKYIARDHVKVYQEDNATLARTPIAISDSNFLNDTTLRNLPVTPVGKTLVIYRDTPKPPMVDFTNGARFTEASLDTAARQGAFIAVESADALSPDGLAGRINQLEGFSSSAETARDQAAASAATATTKAAEALASAVAAELAKDNAVAAASAIGPIKFYDTYAQALGAIGGLASGDLVEVARDETRAGGRTRYRVNAGVLTFVVNLAAGGAVQPIENVSELAGLPKSGSQIAYAKGYANLADGGGGFFILDAADTSSVGNGGTIFVAGDGGRWKRPPTAAISSRCFGVSAAKSASYNRGALQEAITSGYSALLLDGKRQGEVILIDGPLDVPSQMEIVSSGRWATTLRSTATNKPILRYASTSSNCSVRNLHLSYQGTPVAGANAIELNGCQTFDAHRLWISSCWNGIYSLQGGNHELMGIRCYSYENTALLLSSSSDVNLTNFRFHAGDSVKGRSGGIRLEGPVEAFTAHQGDVTLGVYGLTAQDFGSNERGSAPYFNRFSSVLFDSTKSNAARLVGLCHSDFVQCWFASAGHDEAVGWATALDVPGIFVDRCKHLNFVGGDIYSNGGEGAQVYPSSKFIRFGGGVRVRQNRFSRPTDGAGLVFLGGCTDFSVSGASFERAADTVKYRQSGSVEVQSGASDRYAISGNMLGGCAAPADSGAGTNKYIGQNF